MSWSHSQSRRPSPSHVTNADLDLFGRRLRLGEPVEPADVGRIEQACDRIAKQAPIGANIRQTALRVLRYIADWRRAQQITTPANVTDGTSPVGATASKQEGPRQ